LIVSDKENEETIANLASAIKKYEVFLPNRTITLEESLKETKNESFGVLNSNTDFSKVHKTSTLLGKFFLFSIYAVISITSIFGGLMLGVGLTELGVFSKKNHGDL
ncbi:MAG: hypothetical protein ABIH99_05795, partial [Candidatus Micrarchaeota archaeon]